MTAAEIGGYGNFLQEHRVDAIRDLKNLGGRPRSMYVIIGSQA